ncbi:UDP-3-O-(3-hydroxymyristoyl)glucosamine N-acyltransferase [Leptospira borgpetersenii]|uniref:UDP-3-O-[3-hydroxymyristoyl] glucosamine N-acyltransferase n=4 Tax=Leptospira borgpetersenii TaxID=174 RepID=A0A0E3B6Q4_LEPBO|nr:UDP-3-O-(3-hydroxymyristoyl)glucosamine N-acyltransferase [Leptospira borgpetersenii]ALO28144.1 UDP-3-O-[3-hydroxymyristoyl] glucosamine N- acyltransferase [Leptospira borgpetersenii serovar Ballum]ANH02271.1 UDP-3-O-(3-hydroxymyristoyl) glucosamine N-acyltransferase LpxD [Leptospira borgpetersenii str. 4E]KGE26590.1 UDP-3-O-(3-hydroxymyristoyl) glucosamine N-acyltransferase [Leptospira borgpetersenii serovar Ballum]MBE8160916.1 UDP-3-O-(3-hydroxymyristoyl)glucosamine N-acyltransferase [Lept
MSQIKLSELTKKISGSKIINIQIPDTIILEKIVSIFPGAKNSVSFLSNKKMLNEAKKTLSSVILTTEELAKELSIPCLVVSNPELSLAEVLNVLYPSYVPSGKISSTASIHPTAKLGFGVTVGEFVVIGENSVIGANTYLEDGVKVSRNVIIGEDSHIGLNSSIQHGVLIGKRFICSGNCSIGGDGFKFVTANGKHHKIPQVGGVKIGDDVEIGSLCTIDRGGLEDTIIGDGCKFDNMVHVAHNCVLGKNIIIAGQSGVAGSTIVEDDVIIGGACAVADHLHVPAGTILAGGTSLRNSPKKKEIFVGWDYGLTFPEFQKVRVNIHNLVNFQKWAKRIKELEKHAGIKVEEKE